MMKKFALKTTVGAAALLEVGLSQAGTLSIAQTTYAGAIAPASALVVTNYAREALDDSTAVSAPGVAVTFNAFKATIGTPYRVILEVANGSFGNNTGVVPNDTFGAVAGTTTANCVPVTFSGQDASKQLAWECTPITSAGTTEDNFGISFDAGTLKVTADGLKNGGAATTIKASLQSREGFATYDTVAAKDYMKGVQAIDIVAANDTNTKTDVNHANGPLFGFVADATVPADTTTIAQARFVVSNNVPALGATPAVCPDATTAFDMNITTATCGAYVSTNALQFKLTDSREFAALAPSGLTLKAGPSTVPFVTNGDTATVSVTPVVANFAGGAGNTTNVDVSYTATNTASLGAERLIGFAAKVDGQGQAFDFSNNQWWSWGNNGTILKFPAINQSAQTANYVELLNTSSKDASLISADCYTNKTNPVVGMTNKELKGNQSLKVDLKYLCPGVSKVNSVVLTVAAPKGDVTATAISRHKTTGAVSYVNAATGNN